MSEKIQRQRQKQKKLEAALVADRVTHNQVTGEVNILIKPTDTSLAKEQLISNKLSKYHARSNSYSVTPSAWFSSVTVPASNFGSSVGSRSSFGSGFNYGQGLEPEQASKPAQECEVDIVMGHAKALFCNTHAGTAFACAGMGNSEVSSKSADGDKFAARAGKALPIGLSENWVANQLAIYGLHQVLVALTLASERGAKHVSYLSGILSRLSASELAEFDKTGKRVLANATVVGRPANSRLNLAKWVNYASKHQSQDLQAKEEMTTEIETTTEAQIGEGSYSRQAEAVSDTGESKGSSLAVAVDFVALQPAATTSEIAGVPTPNTDLALKLHLAAIDSVTTRYIRKLQVVGDKLLVSFFGITALASSDSLEQRWLNHAKLIYPQLTAIVVV